MLNVHYIYHHSALSCIDAGDHMQFITDFETTMVQLWAFLKNLPTVKKLYQNNLKTCQKKKKRR